jgi:protein-S-isoprenylcysteine O-methyltransferase Ste14
VWVLSTGLLGTLWLVFAAANFEAWLKTGKPIGLGTVVMELVVAGTYAVRRQAVVVSRSAIAWFAAGMGTFGLLLARPHYAPVGGERLGTLYTCLQLLSALTAIASVLTLGRSFGVVAANRGIKTNGPYRLVRHPIYASYLVGMIGYLFENPSLRNVVLLATVIGFQIARIRSEEQCLVGDPEYRAYQQRVRYRLVPFVF